MSEGKVLIIAEAGVNHNGSLDMALRLVDAAAEAGADAVKFQTFRVSRLVRCDTPKARYQVENMGAEGTQMDMLRVLEMDEAMHAAVVERCVKRGIRFLSSPFDEESADWLVERFGMECVKIPSGEITNGPFLLHLARKGYPVILSTGMSTLGEVEEALAVLAYGYVQGEGAPSKETFLRAFCSQRGQDALGGKVVLLHCTSEYPAPPEQVNLKALETLRVAFGLPVGFSDHTEGIDVPIAAVALGACVLEKHFTLDKTLPGPDHKASLEPEELQTLVRGVRRVERALGGARKRFSPEEEQNRSLVRRSLVVSRGMRRGEPLEGALGVKRPGTGRSPMEYWAACSEVAERDYDADDFL